MIPELEKLHRDKSLIDVAIRNIQNNCPHENYTFKYGSNTGNYDPNDDRYWINVTCLDCEKQMSFDSDKDRSEYIKYGSRPVIKPQI